MKLDGFDHLFLETRDYDSMVRFWSGLGFAIIEQWGSKADGHQGCVLRSGDSTVVIGTVGPSEKPQGPSIHFSVKSVDQLAEALKGHRDVQVVTPPEDTHWQTRWLQVKDPEGNVYAIESGRKG